MKRTLIIRLLLSLFESLKDLAPLTKLAGVFDLVHTVSLLEYDHISAVLNGLKVEWDLIKVNHIKRRESQLLEDLYVAVLKHSRELPQGIALLRRRQKVREFL